MSLTPTAPQAAAPRQAAVIQDISGLGRCSLAAALPVLAALGVHACPVPTAVLTSQTGFSRFASFGCTPVLNEFPSVWKDLNVTLDAIYTGFMGSAAQLEAARALMDAFRAPLVLIDPVLGDGGALYPCFGEEYLQAVRRFIARADVLTPNITEACLLTGADYAKFIAAHEDDQLELLKGMCEALPAKRIVITGWVPAGRLGGCAAEAEGIIGNVVYNNGAVHVYTTPRIGGSYSGTGDLFAACLCGYLLRGVSPEIAVPRITAFLEACLRSAKALGAPPEEGVPFELHLGMLIG